MERLDFRVNIDNKHVLATLQKLNEEKMPFFRADTAFELDTSQPNLSYYLKEESCLQTSSDSYMVGAYSSFYPINRWLFESKFKIKIEPEDLALLDFNKRDYSDRSMLLRDIYLAMPILVRAKDILLVEDYFDKTSFENGVLDAASPFIARIEDINFEKAYYPGLFQKIKRRLNRWHS